MEVLLGIEAGVHSSRDRLAIDQRTGVASSTVGAVRVHSEDSDRVAPIESESGGQSQLLIRTTLAQQIAGITKGDGALTPAAQQNAGRL